jgi:valyl-tRNA synthetase
MSNRCDACVADFETVREVVTAIRKIRAEYNVPVSAIIPVTIVPGEGHGIAHTCPNNGVAA